jgi:hypothetical protein
MEHTMSLDLLQFDTKAAAESGYTHILENPFTLEPMLDDAGKPYYINVIGGDASDVVAMSRQVADARLERIQKTKSIVVEGSLARQEDIEIISSAIRGWYLPPIDGQELPFSREAAKKLLGDARFPWIMEQLNKVIGDRKRFFKKNSSA